MPFTADYTFPSGTSVFTNPIIVTGQTGMTLKGQRGSPLGVSRMVYRGPPCPAPIQFVGCTRCTIRDLEIVVETPGVDAAVLIANTVNPPVDGFSTANLIENVRVLHEGRLGPRRDFSVDSFAVGGKEGNNEGHTFRRCYAQSYSECGFYLNGAQCKQLIFDQCQAMDYGGRRGIGVHAANGAYFRWSNGSFTVNSVDIKLGPATQMVVVENTSSELSNQFLVMQRSGGEANVSMANLRVDGYPLAGKPMVDGFGPNSVSIRDSWFTGLNGTCPALAFGGQNGRLDLANVLLTQHGGAIPATPIVTATESWEHRGHGLRWQRIDATGARTTKALQVNQATVQ